MARCQFLLPMTRVSSNLHAVSTIPLKSRPSRLLPGRRPSLSPPPCFVVSDPISFGAPHNTLSPYPLIILLPNFNIFFSQNSSTRVPPKGCAQDLFFLVHVCRARPPTPRSARVAPLGQQQAGQARDGRLEGGVGDVGVWGMPRVKGTRRLAAGFFSERVMTGWEGERRRAGACDACTYAASPVAPISRRSHLSPGLSKHQFAGVHDGLPLSRGERRPFFLHDMGHKPLSQSRTPPYLVL